jgi:cubilin
LSLRCIDNFAVHIFDPLDFEVTFIIFLAGKCRTSAILTKSFGTFHSPGYPRNYTNNVQSSWHIRVPKGYRIRIRFRKDFHVEDSTLCHKDALIVAFDKSQKNTKLFCGKKRQRGVTSSTNELWLIFRSDDAGIAKGFFATYRAIGKKLRAWIVLSVK